MWDWSSIGSFLWRWLPLFGLVGFISGIFTLRDRVRNWWATKSAKNLKKRLKQINEQAILTKLHRSDPALFFIQLLKDGYLPAGAFIGAIFVIIAILGSLSNIIRNPAGAIFDDISVKLFGLQGMFFLSVVMNFFVKTNTKDILFLLSTISCQRRREAISQM
jgi:hypothetical protein